MALYYYPVITYSNPGEISMVVAESSDGAASKSGLVNPNSGKPVGNLIIDVLSKQGTLEPAPYPLTFNYLYSNFNGKTDVIASSMMVFTPDAHNLNFMNNYDLKQIYKAGASSRSIIFTTCKDNVVLIHDTPGKNLQYVNTGLTPIGNFNPKVAIIVPETGVTCELKVTCQEAVTLKGEARVAGGRIDLGMVVRYRQRKIKQYRKSSNNTAHRSVGGNIVALGQLAGGALGLPLGDPNLVSEYDDGPCPLLETNPSTWDISVIGNGRRGIANTTLTINGSKSHVNTKTYSNMECGDDNDSKFGVALTINTDGTGGVSITPIVEFGDRHEASGYPGSPRLPWTLSKLKDFGSQAAQIGTAAYSAWLLMYSSQGKTSKNIATGLAAVNLSIATAQLVTSLNGYKLNGNDALNEATGISAQLASLLWKVGHFAENPAGRIWEAGIDFIWDIIDVDLSTRISDLKAKIESAISRAEEEIKESRKLITMQVLLERILKNDEVTVLLDTLNTLVANKCDCA